ncbi:rubredoxin-like domain-containing protein [Methanotorris formicicus]|uniref:Rubrerythrin rubredoxin-like domain-containing protein n=1 Tax=Methanotorris formicicus Mc-S-70 TaxID=647171 RepID=H1KW65_9EURY|nr:hypothetical protein MetfoDRAFT_0038 [Methanotorris formicicus Mc-S-70]
MKTLENLLKATEPPEECPSCGHSKNYYVAIDMLSL